MDEKKIKLPDDLSLCHEIILELLDDKEKSQVLIDKLQHQLEQLLKARYGPRADRIHPDQMQLFAQELLSKMNQEGAEQEEECMLDSEEDSPKSRQRKGHGRRAFPKSFPRIEREHDVEPEDKICRQCGKEKACIRKEVSEQLEYIPASLHVIQHICPVYACPSECEGQMVTASKPLQPIERGIAGPGLLAKVTTSKYCDHLPLNRQENIFKRHGVVIPRSTQSDWMRSCADLMEPLYVRMKERVLSSKKIHTDDTPVPVLDKTQTKTKKGRIWCYLGDSHNPYAVYDYTPTRKRDGPVNFLGNFSGYLQADAYGGYDGIYAGGKVKEVACWAHARRKFVDVQTTNAPGAVTAIAWIKALYKVERKAKEYLNSLPEEMALSEKHAKFVSKRQELRQETAKEKLGELKEWLFEQQKTSLPKSPFRQAVTYALHNWKALTRYLDDGELEIDNNSAERAMRCIAVGRRNWLFAGSDRGGRTAAILYSFVTTCKNHYIDPFKYFRDVFARISAHPMSRIDELLPDNWKALQKADQTVSTSQTEPTLTK
jgi:transposase